jgi:erythromycin esterase
LRGIRQCAFLAAACASLAPTPYRDASVAAFQAWARAAEIPLSTTEWSANDSDLASLAKMVGTARVVAIGEPGHGAHQPLAFRNRLFGYLVAHCGFTAIGLETSFTEARAIDNFVMGGRGDAAAIAKRDLTWGFGGYEENVQLIRWMRDYNEHAREGRKLHFYGIDMSGANDDADFTHAEIAVLSVVRYLRRVSPTSFPREEASIAPQLRLMARVGYRQMAISQEPALDDVLNSLQAYLVANARALRRASSQTDYDWAAHNLVVTRQLRDYLRLQPAPEGTSTRIGPMDYLLDDVRENAMATNTIWALREEGPRGRLLVFAHDAHVMSTRSSGGMWNVFKEPPVMMGEYLRAHLGRQLLIIGTLAEHNGPGLPVGRLIPGSMEAALERLGVPIFALDLRTAQGDAGARGWLDERRPIRANFDTQLDVVPARAFDVIVFMDTITPAIANRKR